MPNMAGKLSVVAIVALAALSVSGVAFAAPTTMNLSSWEPTVENGTIVGGTRTVTLTNITSQTIDEVTFSLEPAPCDCSATTATPSDGNVADGTWTIDDLDPGETVTLTLSYVESPVVALAAPGTDARIPATTELAVVGLAVVAGILGTLGRRTLSTA